eukprot:7288109-Lingulodinium_polyedra.AAC.1
MLALALPAFPPCVDAARRRVARAVPQVAIWPVMAEAWAVATTLASIIETLPYLEAMGAAVAVTVCLATSHWR